LTTFRWLLHDEDLVVHLGQATGPVQVTVVRDVATGGIPAFGEDLVPGIEAGAQLEAVGVLER
jgi:hypothetical protein